MNDEELKVAENMVKYGGSFVAALGEAIYHADPNNLERIKITWPEYYEQYKRMKQ